MAQILISDLFLGVRAKKGDAIARTFLDDSNIKQMEKLDLEIESLSMSLQMLFGRIQGSALVQMHSKQIGNQLAVIIEDGINKLVAHLASNPKIFCPLFEQIFQQTYDDMDASSQEVYPFVQSLNLQHDFPKIIFQIQSFPYHNIIRTLKCLVVASVRRRYKRRQYFRS